MRGLYTATKLQRLAFLFDGRFADLEPDIGKAFDLICGTSTGSILACALAAQVPLGEVRRLYIDEGPRIFPSPMPHTGERCGYWPFRLPAVLPWLKRHARRATGEASHLKAQLQERFRDETLGGLYARRGVALCVPVVDAAAQKAVVLKTPHHDGKHRDDNWRLVDVCMASSAAPIFMPLYRQQSPIDEHQVCTYVDGGLWANSPVLIALVEALQATECRRPIHIISVGTSNVSAADPLASKEASLDWGVMQWWGGIKVLEMSMAAQATGHTAMADLIAHSLRRTGLDVQIIRLREGEKSAQEAQAIGLDRADHGAVQTLLGLAQRDADQVHGEILRTAEQRSSGIIRGIFTELEPLEPTN